MISVWKCSRFLCINFVSCNFVVFIDELLIDFWWCLQDFLHVVYHLQTVIVLRLSSLDFVISVSLLISVGRTSSTVLNKHGKSGHSYLIPN